MSLANKLQNVYTNLDNGLTTQSELITQISEALIERVASTKVEQEKSIEIISNGTTEVTPDEGKTLSKVSITTNIESNGSGVDFLDLKNTLSSYNNNELTSLDNYAFAGCLSLTSIDLPVCTYIGGSAFANCRSLTSVDLPKCSVFGYYAFYSCTSLTSVNLPACRHINNYLFTFCTSLVSIDLPVCTTVGYSAFADCTSLISVDLPVCTSIGGYAFSGCRSLTSVNLPMCSSIAASTFYQCSSLTSLTLGYSSVVKLGNINAFTDTPMSIFTLTSSFGSIYVPASLVDAYKSATNWTAYADRITAIVE